MSGTLVCRSTTAASERSRRGGIRHSKRCVSDAKAKKHRLSARIRGTGQCPKGCSRRAESNTRDVRAQIDGRRVEERYRLQRGIRDTQSLFPSTCVHSFKCVTQRKRLHTHAAIGSVARRTHLRTRRQARHLFQTKSSDDIAQNSIAPPDS